MEQLKRSNPLRADLRWEWILIQGALAIAIALYALLAPESARGAIVFLIGVFLLVNGLGLAINGLRKGDPADPMGQFRMIRAGVGIATGLIVVLNGFLDFFEVNPARVVAGIGLVGIGVVSLVGLVKTAGRSNINATGIGVAILLIAWGIATFVQAANDSNSSKIIGWVALVIGVGLVGLAMMRRQKAAAPA